jgi:tetratricopeptide (TPR) repeat protein
MFQRAITLDPEYALAHASLGNTYLFDYTFKLSQGPQALDQAIMHLRQAISLDDSLSIAHATIANAYRMKGQIELSMAEVGRAISLNPYDAEGHYILGAIQNVLGESEDALEAIEKAMQLNPHYPGRYLIGLSRAYRGLGKDGEAIRVLNEAVARDPDYTMVYSELAATYRQSGRYQEAIGTLKEALAQYPEWVSVDAHVELAILYAGMDREKEARAEAAKILKMSPDFSVKVWGDGDAHKDPAQAERDMAALRKAGL